MKQLEEALKSLSSPPIKVETFKRNLRRELLAQTHSEAQRPRGTALYWGFLVATLSAASFAATAILFIAIPSLPAKLHQALGGNHGGQTLQQPLVANPSQDLGNGMPQYQPVKMNPSDMRFLEQVFENELPQAGFDPSLLEDDGEVILRRYRDASGRAILVVTETSDLEKEPHEDDRVY